MFTFFQNEHISQCFWLQTGELSGFTDLLILRFWAPLERVLLAATEVPIGYTRRCISILNESSCDPDSTSLAGYKTIHVTSFTQAGLKKLTRNKVHECAPSLLVGSVCTG